MLTQPWRIEMLGEFCACLDTQRITRFKSHKAASLLAYLALYSAHPHSRDELVTLCWPDDERDAARNRFRVTLNSLRRQLEPPELPSGSVLLADRLTVSLRPQAVVTDVREFEAALEAALSAEEGEPQIALLRSAVKAYRGEMLPGFLEEWVVGERIRLAERYRQALHRLVRGLVSAQDLAGALTYALQAVQADALREESYRDVMRLYVALGQPSAALHWYTELERLLAEHLEARPAASTRQIAAQIAEKMGHGVAVVAGMSSVQARPDALPEPTVQPIYPSQGGDLPRPLTRFFGREPEIAILLGRLMGREDAAPTRLLTLTGIGGAGKTRLAIETVRRWQVTASEGRTRFVPLAELSDPRQIPAAIAAALPLPLAPGQDAYSQVCAFLALHRTLLVLDNLEHLVEEAAPLVAALLEQVPNLTCLVTSRRCLGIEGEEEWTVEPLPLPEALPADTLSALMVCPSVQLFVDRAQAVLPHFQVTSRNAAEISALCRELEGIPLALELAAARARVLTPGQMRSHLAQRFELLINRRASKDVRHRSLHATIEWSVQLLPPDLRRLFLQLSVFHGGWTLEAAAAILGEHEEKDQSGNRGEKAEEKQAEEEKEAGKREEKKSRGLWETSSLLDGLEQLRTDSLIVAEEVAGEMRFRMLETLREFAASQLALQSSREARERLAMRHASFYADFAEEARNGLKGREQAHWLDRLEQERPNLRAAYETAQQSPNKATAERGLCLTRALWRFWVARGPLEEGCERAGLALAHADAQEATTLRAGALGAAGAMAVARDDYATAQVLYAEQKTVSEKIGFAQGIALALDNMGCLEIRRGDYALAQTLEEESLALYRSLEDRPAIALVLSHLALIADRLGDTAQALTWSEESLKMHRESGDHLVVASLLGNMGLIAERQGKWEQARSLHSQSLAIHQELGNRIGIAGALMNLGSAAAKVGDANEGRTRLTESLRLFQELSIPKGIAMAMGSLGELEYQLGDYASAHRLQTANLEIQCRLGAREGIFFAQNSLALISIKQDDYGKARSHMEKGLALCRESGHEGHLTELLETFALLAEVSNHMEEAVHFYGAADTARERLKRPLYPAQAEARQTACLRLRTSLGEANFTEVLTAGQKTLLQEAILNATSFAFL